MKLINYLLLPVAVFSFSAATAQSKTNKSATTSAKPAKDTTVGKTNSIHELSDLIYKGVKTQSTKGVEVISEQDVKKTIEYFNSNAEIRVKRDKFYSSNYSKPIVFERLPDESDRIKWLKGIPVPKYPEAALQADPRENQRYEDKVEKHVEQLKIEARQLANKTELMQTYEQGGTEAVKKKYEKEANKSEIVQRMGGVENMQNMSEKERQEAAKKMVSDMTGGYTAEQIKNMSQAERQELAKKMAAAKMQNMQAGDYRNVDHKAMNEAKEVELIGNFQAKFAADLQKELEPVNNAALRNEEQWNAEMEKLSKWIAAATNALPVVRDSEYGPRRDGIEYVIFTEEYMRYTLGKGKIARDREVWERYVRVYADAFKQLDDFLATYSNKKVTSDQMKFALAGLLVAGYDTVSDMNKKAGYITNEAASFQYNYNCKALGNCKDPRQDKY